MQQKKKAMFEVVEASTVRSDISFSSYIKAQNKSINMIKTEDSDQISIFDAAKYFSGVHDNQQQQQQQKEQFTKEVDVVLPIPPRVSSVSSSVATSSNHGGRNYRTRSFHATPTASSEASWNSQAGLLSNPPGSAGISIASNSNGSRGTSNSNTSGVKWPRISAKWLNKGRKCPCLGKKSVQVDERMDSETMPRMVDLGQANSNGTNFSYSPRQISPRNLGPIVPSSTSKALPNDSKDSNYNRIGYPNNNKSNCGGLNSKLVGPSKLYNDLAKVGGANAVSTNANATTTAAASTTVTATSNGFTFPILENPPVGVKKMFNVIPPSHDHTIDEPHRDSLEVFQPRSHPSPNKSRRTSYEDENVSDGSSDLFEIESFSAPTYPYRDSMDEMIIPSSNFATTMKRLGIVCPAYNNNQYKKNDNVHENGIDDIDEEPITPSVAPTDCYAPSEVSIDWSVTTAEGFDRGSLSNFSASASDFAYATMRREAEQYKSIVEINNRECKGCHKDNIKGSGKNNNSGGVLSGCRNEKAISVGRSPIKCTTKEGPQTNMRHVSGGPQIARVAQVNSKPNLVGGRSRSNNYQCLLQHENAK